VETVVDKYLTNDKVVIKGAVSGSFKNSIEVFVRRKQRKCVDGPSLAVTQVPTTLEALQKRLDSIRDHLRR